MLIKVASTSLRRKRFFVSQGIVSHCTLTFYFSTQQNVYLKCNEINHHILRREFSSFGYSREYPISKFDSDYQPACLQHWFKNWHELRRSKLTASTFGGAIGFWPRRRVQLWREKIGEIEPFSGNIATIWNNVKEEEALERYKLITGNNVYFPEFQIYSEQDRKDEWLGCSPDGVVDRIFYGLPSRGVLEIKCPFFGGDKKISYPWKRIPLYCIPQAQGLMEIMDREWMDFYVWTLNGSSLFRIHRDREYWDLLRLALSDFWWEHVYPAKEIRTKYGKSSLSNPSVQLQIQKFRPAPRHELHGALIYASKCVAEESVLLVREIRGKLVSEQSWYIHGLGSERSVELGMDQMTGQWLDKEQAVGL